MLSCRVHEEQDLFAISGSLLEPGTGVSASVSAGAVAAAPEATADALAAAPQQSAAAALRAPCSKGRPRVVAATLAPVGGAETSDVATKQPGTLAEAAPSAPDQPVDPAAKHKAGWKRDRPLSAPSEDGGHAAHDGERKKRKQKEKKRKRQDGTPAQTAPGSDQPAAATSLHATAQATDDGRGAAPDAGQRQHKKRRRDRDAAANGGAALMASLAAHSQPQQPNGPVAATGDMVPPGMKRKKRRREEVLGTAVRADMSPTEQAAELADSGMAERKKHKKQKRTAAADAAELPNGFHSAASADPQTIQIARPAQKAAAGVDRPQINGIKHHQDSLARKKLKAKHKQGAAEAPLAQ